MLNLLRELYSQDMFTKFEQFLKLTTVGFLVLSISLSGISSPILVNLLTPLVPQSSATSQVSPLLVVFGNSMAEQKAVQTLLSNFPMAVITQFSLTNAQILSWTGPVIWVGHGNSKGILSQGGLISWNLISTLVKSSVSQRHFFLSCDSVSLKQLTVDSNKMVITFNGRIEPVLGALYVAAYLSKTIGAFNSFFRRLKLVLNNPLNFDFLGICESIYHTTYHEGYFSANERYYAAPSIVGAIAGILFTATLASSGRLVNKIRFFAAFFWLNSRMSMTMLTFLEGIFYGDAYGVFSVIVAVISFIYSVILMAIKSLPWWEQAFSFAAAAADSAAATAAPYLKTLALIYGLYGLMLSINAAIKDLCDPDPYITVV